LLQISRLSSPSLAPILGIAVEMAVNLQIPRLFQKSLSPKPYQINHLLLKYLCTTPDFPLTTHDTSNSPESPDLPTWLSNSQNQKPSDPDDGDFVIPSLANWVENPNLETHRNVPSPLLFEPQVSNADKLSEILKKRYSSEAAVVKALNESGIDATNELVSQILMRFDSHCVVAFGVFIWAKNQTSYVHTPELYDYMIDILGKFKKFSLMWNLVEQMKGLNGYVSLATASKVMRRLAKARKYKDAIDVFRGIEKYGASKDREALNVLMDALVKEGDVEDAHSAFLEFKDCITLDSSSFNILIHGYCKARMFVVARKIMEEMEKHGFHPDVVSYSCFIAAYCEQKDFRNVEAVFDEMQEKGCKPNVITYTTVMHALGKARQLNEALEVYEKMKRNGCLPDSKFYSSLIYVLSQSGRIKDAWDVFEDMEKQGVCRNLWVYNTMISSACAHSQGGSALKLLERMEGDSCKPDVKTYAPLLKMCCRRKSIKLLKFLLSHMFKNNVSVDLGTYTLLVNEFCRNGKLEHACFYFQEAVLKGMVPMVKTFKALVEELEQKNMKEMKEKIEKLMFQARERNLT
jgi:pentatricopeptide repeat protein